MPNKETTKGNGMTEHQLAYNKVQLFIENFGIEGAREKVNDYLYHAILLVQMVDAIAAKGQDFFDLEAFLDSAPTPEAFCLFK